MPSGVNLQASDSPNGPWVELSPSEFKAHSFKLGKAGVNALLMGALDSAIRAVAFPTEKWNRMQASRPGGPHQRWHAGDIIEQSHLDALDSASKQFGLYSHDRRELKSESGVDKGTLSGPEVVGGEPSPKRAKTKRALRTPTEKQQFPEDLTRSVSLTVAADWFDLKDRRTLLKSIGCGAIKAMQISPLKWVFDLSQLSESARKDATPKQ